MALFTVLFAGAAAGSIYWYDLGSPYVITGLTFLAAAFGIVATLSFSEAREKKRGGEQSLAQEEQRGAIVSENERLRELLTDQAGRIRQLEEANTNQQIEQGVAGQQVASLDRQLERLANDLRGIADWRMSEVVQVTRLEEQVRELLAWRQQAAPMQGDHGDRLRDQEHRLERLQDNVAALRDTVDAATTQRREVKE